MFNQLARNVSLLSGIFIASPWVLAQTALVPLGDAPREGLRAGTWSSGIKQYFGTAFEDYDANNQYSDASPTAPLSKVWFTGAKGIVTEVYWPTVDRPQVRDSEILVSDGHSFLFEEKRDAGTTVNWVENGVPAYTTVNSDPGGRFSIERTIYTDPDRDVLRQEIKIIRNVAGLKFYVLHNPSVGNSPMADNGKVAIGDTATAMLAAWQGDHEAQAMVASVPIKQASAGFEALNDGFQDLLSDFTMDSHFEYARDGNVVLTGWLDVPDTVGETKFTLALGFGTNIDAAAALARASIGAGDAPRTKYIEQWRAYQSRVLDLSNQSTDAGHLFRASVAILKSMEDKTYEGAFIASPTIPWGQHREDMSPISPLANNQARVGGYHLIWPRDLYEMATTFLAINDPHSAIASLQYYKRIQLGPSPNFPWNYGADHMHDRDGSFTQNSWVTGESYWGNLQMDQVGMPMVLAYRLWKGGFIQLSDYWDMVHRAGDFIQSFGPWTAQDRWEENMGISPSTVAAEIAALWVGAEMADAMNDHDRADAYRAKADSWSANPNANLEAWTFTTTGSLGNGKYYERIEAAKQNSQDWNPNDDAMYMIANTGGLHAERDVVDPGFLELVRFGVRPALDYHIRESIYEVDQNVRVNTRFGPGFRRYLYDRYNYADTSNENTPGMLWPLLTGERGHFELEKAVEEHRTDSEIDGAVVPYIQAMEHFATPSLMLPEQVWDGGDFVGQPTGAATPLGWSHGEYVKLLRARKDRAITERIPSVVQRTQDLGRATWIDGTPHFAP